MKIVIETIPNEKQRYPTVGDYLIEADGTRHIFVSDMGNDDYALLVALHELIEQTLTEKRGIKEEDITAFDEQFEEERTHGIHTDDEEAGDDINAPYRKEHFFSTSIERLMAGELGVDWKTYDDTVMSL